MVKLSLYNSIPTFGRNLFNCGGFALGTLDWVLLDMPGWDYYETDEELEEATEDCVSQLLEMFAGQLRVIEKPEDKEKYEEIVLFRVSSCRDYHFLVQHGNVFYHKRGGIAKLFKMSIDEAYNSDWAGETIEYDGPTVIFAKLKPACHYVYD